MHKFLRYDTPMGETYAARNKLLQQIGFSSYAEYLDSDLWEKIRRHVFATKGGRCKGCQATADVVHHVTYNRDTLLGIDITHLIPVCNACHLFIEFDGGRKRTLAEAQGIACVCLRVRAPHVESREATPSRKRARSSKSRKQKRRLAILQMGGTGSGSIANYQRVLREYEAATGNKGPVAR